MECIQQKKKELNKEILINTMQDIKHNNRSISPIRKNFITQVDIIKKLKGTGNIKVYKNKRNFSTLKKI
jgi:hypothetical protein